MYHKSKNTIHGLYNLQAQQINCHTPGCVWLTLLLFVVVVDVDVVASTQLNKKDFNFESNTT